MKEYTQITLQLKTLLDGDEWLKVLVIKSIDQAAKENPDPVKNPVRSLELMLLFEKINEMGTTILVVTHEKELVNAFSKRVITIDSGEKTGDSSEGGYYGI